MARKNPIYGIEGSEILEEALKRIGNRAGGFILRDAAEEGAKPIVDEARRLAPRDSGDLAEGIAAEVHRIQAGRTQINISYARDQFYGAFHEVGSDHQVAKPYLRPAFDAKAEEATEAVAKALREALKDVLE